MTDHDNARTKTWPCAWCGRRYVGYWRTLGHTLLRHTVEELWEGTLARQDWKKGWRGRLRVLRDLVLFVVSFMFVAWLTARVLEALGAPPIGL